MLKFHWDYLTSVVPYWSESKHKQTLISDVIAPEEMRTVCSNVFITNRGHVKWVGFSLIIMHVVLSGEDRDVWDNYRSLYSLMVDISAALTWNLGHCRVGLYLFVLVSKTVPKSHNYCRCNTFNLLKTVVGYDASLISLDYSLVELPFLLLVIDDKRQLLAFRFCDDSLRWILQPLLYLVSF